MDLDPRSPRLQPLPVSVVSVRLSDDSVVTSFYQLCQNLKAAADLKGTQVDNFGHKVMVFKS